MEIGETIGIIVRGGIVLFLVLNIVPLMVFAERKVSAFIQDRVGPEKAGLYGLLHPLADALKFILKEAFVPPQSNKFLYYIGPFITAVVPMLAFIAVPIIPVLQPVSTELSVLVVLAFSSLGVWGILLGGWSSENKFSLLGSLRASSQFISYEVALSISLLSMLIIYGTFDFVDIVKSQEGWKWGIILNPIAFIVFFISVLAESARIPFDLPEAEGELIGGFHTEYSGMKFAMFFMGEYMHLTLGSCLIILLFLGGWNLPFIKIDLPDEYLFSSVIEYIIYFGVFSAKLFTLLVLFVVIRWTLPRFRFDQLIRLGWGTLIPLSLLGIVISAAYVVISHSK
ncbi:MAG: NADH-quinone oxidoreductase subunit NuoH [Candidatus Calescibacterium sp.]|nr:NADH-quinone oxidoreductase subunit NuoH [Candidatus Calescibacterium sp.]MDW8087688.1 NADH-quinone oxidoreductase subunit NuoH [Candidatus Calescibacterium sp.]